MEEVKDTIFVGGIPYDMTLEEFEEELAAWGPVTKKYLKYHGGWGTVTFESNSSRNRFLKDKSKHKLGSKLVDIKPYIFNPEKVKSSGVSHLVIGKGQVKMTTETSMKAREEAKNMSIIERQMSDLQVANQQEAQTGAVIKYFGDADGLIKTPKHGEIAFSIETVYLCKVHKYNCRDSQCTNYIPLKKWNVNDMAKLFPIGTTVSFYSRSIVFKDIPDYKYQATLVWPQASKKPSTANLPTADELNQLMIRFAMEYNRPKYTSSMAWASLSSSPTPSQTSSNTSSKISVNGPPGFSSSSQFGGFPHLLLNNDKSKFDYDVPLESLLDDADNDIDNEAEILMWIKDFLHAELGKLGGNVPMLLMNNIRSLGSDEMVLQEIVDFAKTKQIPIDNAKRDSIAYGLKRLRQRIRSREDHSTPHDKSASASASTASLVEHASLTSFTVQDLDFIYDMPLNHEYLSLLETLYGRFLKSENLEFRMDFDQAFMKLSPFMAFKTFTWILDWMTNDRRKKLRQYSDLKYFNDSEEILGAVEQFWNDCKRSKAKQLFSVFLHQNQEQTHKMLICYMKHHIVNFARMKNVLKIIKELKPDEVSQFSSMELPSLKTEDLKSKAEFNIDTNHMRKHYERFLTWLDLQLIRESLAFVQDANNHKLHDKDFQKLALVHAWYKSSKTCNDLEEDLLSSANSIKSLCEKWRNGFLNDYNGLDSDPGCVTKTTLDFLADKLELSRAALDFAWSISENQGFVAQHYNDSIGIIITVKGEVIIFEKSVVAIETSENHWTSVSNVQQLKIGTFVKVRVHPTKVAEKVWPIKDLKTKEPFRSTSTTVKGEKYYTSMAKNLTELAAKLPALKSIVGPKAVLKDLYFKLKTFSYLPNSYKRNTFDPYLESKESLNGDHSEAVDVLSSMGIDLCQLTDLYMASKLLGFEGHEKIIDILATAKVGVPDPLNFALDLTSFFDENCKKDVLAVKSKAKNDIKMVLKSAENYILKSGLFKVEFKVEKANGSTSSMEAPIAAAVVNGNGLFDYSAGDAHGDHEDFGKLASIERNLLMLNKEVKRIRTVEESEKQLRLDFGHLKRDQDAKQATLKQSLKPIMDTMAELSQDLDALKKEIKEMKGLKLAPGVAPFKKTSAIYVKVAEAHNRSEVHEFPTDENGNLSFTAVNAVYPGVNALKFEFKSVQTKSIRLCRKIGDIFEPPEDGWGDRLYIVHTPNSTALQTGLSLSQAIAPPSVTSLTQSAFGHPLFPGYLPPTQLQAAANPFSTGSMFK